MKGQLALMPVIFLVSGTVLTVCGLAALVAMGPAAPPAALVVLAVGLLDGVTGLVWTALVLFSRRASEESAVGDATRRSPAGGEATRGGAMSGRAPGPGAGGETEHRLVLASGLLSVIFLGVVLAILLYLHVIVACLRGWHIL